jgi:hypothetical protein
MAQLVIGLTDSLLRRALGEIMEDRKIALDWIASEMKIPTENLRRWMHAYEPETNRQRYEWYDTHDKVVCFIQAQP